MRYTVILGTPDRLTDYYVQSFTMFHITLGTRPGTVDGGAENAVDAARREALELYEVSENEMGITADSFHVVAVFAGHHDDLDKG